MKILKIEKKKSINHNNIDKATYNSAMAHRLSFFFNVLFQSFGF